VPLHRVEHRLLGRAGGADLAGEAGVELGHRDRRRQQLQRLERRHLLAAGGRQEPRVED